MDHIIKLFISIISEERTSSSILSEQYHFSRVKINTMNTNNYFNEFILIINEKTTREETNEHNEEPNKKNWLISIRDCRKATAIDLNIEKNRLNVI